VLLSTVHRAKGLEAERVFLLYPDKLPLQWENQQAWELRQEMNLKYVALIRAWAELYFVVE
jgi:DNA helicase II / ATP-dependent DNA helicase PcrA